MSAYRHAERFSQEPPQNTALHAAAYQRAQQLGNDGQVFDYRRKVGVAWTGIMAPACTPKELLDAQILWNTVERLEHRTNARLAREMIIALPHQLDLEAQLEMLRRFVTAHLVARGMVADCAIHRPPVEHRGDPRNWHAHVLLTDRPMTAHGFAATKDRTWNARENITLWRKAWADTHNSMMAELGMPHRIDHRSLEDQRADALARGDAIAALDLDREPQIHVGKAHHATHPKHTIYRDRRDRNQAILTRNKTKAAAHKDHVQEAIARLNTAADLEGRINAVKQACWEPPELELNELEARYGRPPSKTVAGEFHAAIIRTKANAAAMAISAEHRHPWRATGHYEGAPSILDLILPRVHETGAGHPLFTVTAKDLAFAFYGWGLISKRELQRSLEHVAQEETRLPASRKAKRKPPPPPPQPPRFPTPHADALARTQRRLAAPQAIYWKRLAQLTAFNERHAARNQQRHQRTTLRLAQQVPSRPKRSMAFVKRSFN